MKQHSCRHITELLLSKYKYVINSVCILYKLAEYVVTC